MRRKLLLCLLMVTHTAICIFSGAIGWELQFIIVINANVLTICLLLLKYRCHIKEVLFCISPFYALYVPFSIYLRSYQTFPIWIIGIITCVIAYLLFSKNKITLTIIAGLFFQLTGYYVILPNNFAHTFQKQPAQYELGSSAIVNEVNERFNLRKYRGKVLLFDIWHSACRPCIRKFPKLEELHNDFNVDTNVAIFSLNIPLDSTDRLSSGNITQRYTFTKLYFRSFEESKTLSIDAVPLILIIDKKGKCRYAGDLNTEWNIFTGNAKRIINNLKKEI